VCRGDWENVALELKVFICYSQGDGYASMIQLGLEDETSRYSLCYARRGI